MVLGRLGRIVRFVEGKGFVEKRISLNRVRRIMVR